jgi:ribonuclease PH
VAVCDAIRQARQHRWITRSPVTDAIAAVSVGRVDGKVLVDLTYEEDRGADVDVNVAMTGSGAFVEIQGAGEETTYTREELNRMLRAAERGIRRLIAEQRRALRRRL